MFEIADQLKILVPGYMLVFTRISAMLATMPVYSFPMISGRIRIMLAFILTLIIGSIVGADSFPIIENIWVLSGLILKEIIIGTIIGFGSRLIFEGFAIAGGVVGMQMGIAMANVMDPSTQQQVPLISQFWMIVMVLFLLAIDGHYFLIETFFRNFEMIPLGLGNLSADAGNSIIRGGSKVFETGIRFAAPAMAFLLLVDTAIGFMARVMPQMNVFFVAMPLKIGVGIIMLMVSLDIFQLMFDSVYDEMMRFTVEMIGLLS